MKQQYTDLKELIEKGTTTFREFQQIPQDTNLEGFSNPYCYNKDYFYGKDISSLLRKIDIKQISPQYIYIGKLFPNIWYIDTQKRSENYFTVDNNWEIINPMGNEVNLIKNSNILKYIREEFKMEYQRVNSIVIFKSIPAEKSKMYIGYNKISETLIRVFICIG